MRRAVDDAHDRLTAHATEERVDLEHNDDTHGREQSRIRYRATNGGDRCNVLGTQHAQQRRA